MKTYDLHTWYFPVVMAIVLTLSVSADVSAQLFGSARQMGRPIAGARSNSRSGGNASGNQSGVAGQVRNSSRFLRSNRRRQDFVGSDSVESRGFVGSQQGRANGPVMSATVGVRPDIDRSSQVNQPLPKPANNKPYHPRLQLGFSTDAAPGLSSSSQLQRELENSSYFSTMNRFEVLVAGRSAILRGVVADAKQKELAELLLSFEPGISEVQNDLMIASDLPGYGERQRGVYPSDARVNSELNSNLDSLNSQQNDQRRAPDSTSPESAYPPPPPISHVNFGQDPLRGELPPIPSATDDSPLPTL